MKKSLLLSVISTVIVAACQQPAPPPQTVLVEDSSLIDVPDTVTPETIIDSITTIKADTISYSEAQLLGKWLQPVPGVDKATQGFQLKKNGGITSINTYSMVYDKWSVSHDTLLFWSHIEGRPQKDSAVVIDTILIRSLTDTSLVLFPIKAAEGYIEEYKKAAKKK
ncbi:lipocalin-like domain-containing protein [Chitinophaga rhizophila]|uniref:Lipocalin family protein n=1 Tax=Chitinophaga rhizophila TaxID=2866212 RepID=A0ABS7GE78_9BACT|nr:lipocalin family protein [Chitinophaga rhizophila]MBW8685969.1 lipocalin family protein [Chitinophaga rhizophila]